VNRPIKTRPGTLDEWIVEEQLYYDPLGIRAGDRVLDLGGHIGAFAARAAAFGGVITSVEPDPENFALLLENTRDLPVTGIHAAVVPSTQETVTLYRETGENTGKHSLHIRRGRQAIDVPALRWAAVVDLGPFDVAKCDIEGAEYHLPLWELGVRTLAVELHLQPPGWRDEAARLVARIERGGYRAVRAPWIGAENWHTLGIWALA
jgi:FkbM family methyltransferase